MTNKQNKKIMDLLYKIFDIHTLKNRPKNIKNKYDEVKGHRIWIEIHDKEVEIHFFVNSKGDKIINYLVCMKKTKKIYIITYYWANKIINFLNLYVDEKIHAYYSSLGFNVRKNIYPRTVSDKEFIESIENMYQTNNRMYDPTSISFYRLKSDKRKFSNRLISGRRKVGR